MFPKKSGFDEKKRMPAHIRAFGAAPDSEDDEPAPDQYHVLRRRLDRGFMRDPAQRRRERMQAMGWPRPDKGILNPALLITDPALAFVQTDGHCVANCAIFTSMRRRGFAPAEIIQVLRAPGPMQAARERWQRSHDDLIDIMDDALATALAMPMTDVENHLHRYLANGPAVQGKTLDRSPTHPIISTHIIGQYPNRNPFNDDFRQAFSLHVENGSNLASFTPEWPEVDRPRSFQQQLFSRYCGNGPDRVRLAGLKVHHDAPMAREAWRTPEPFIVLDIFWSTRRVHHGHVFLLDLSDPEEPGIFDPNFGWFSFSARAAYRPIEFVLHTLWEYYVRPSPPGYFQGGPKPRANRRSVAFIFAFQTWCQDLILPPPKPRSWRDRFLRR